MALTHKFKVRDGLVEEELTRSRAIKHKCMDCSNWQPEEVRECPITTCALYAYRGVAYPKKESAILTDERHASVPL